LIIVSAKFFAGGREDAILDTLGSISKVLGREAEYRQFVEYVSWAGQDRMPSSIDIASHTPTWVQLFMPLLGNLYDAGYEKGQLDAGFGFMLKKKGDK
jgi:hypothetical protein